MNDLFNVLLVKFANSFHTLLSLKFGVFNMSYDIYSISTEENFLSSFNVMLHVRRSLSLCLILISYWVVAILAEWLF